MTKASKNATILVADDDPEILKLVGRRLSAEGYKVLEAQDGEEALVIARAEAGTPSRGDDA